MVRFFLCSTLRPCNIAGRLLRAVTLFFVFAVWGHTSALYGASPAGSNGYAVWESPSRFYEFSADGSFRLVLKPYYSFVYEASPALTWEATTLPVAPTLPSSTSLQSATTATTTTATTDENPVLVLLRYPASKSPATIPLYVTQQGLYLSFFVCTRPEPATQNNVAQNSATIDNALPCNGFWEQVGSRDAIRLYDEMPADELFCWYFYNGYAWLIRYWKTDLEYRAAPAVLTNGADTHEIPRFLQKDGAVYSCVTLNEKTVRHVLSGTCKATSGETVPQDRAVQQNGAVPQNGAGFVLTPEAPSRAKDIGATRCSALRGVVQRTNENGIHEFFVPATYQPGGIVFVSGSPDAVPLKLPVDKDSAQLPTDVTMFNTFIAEHNALRRPPRKPFFAYLDLDFHWDDVVAISGPELDFIRDYLKKFSVPWISEMQKSGELETSER